MAVEFQSYSATASATPWTASQLANLFQSALADAGHLPNGWHDAFSGSNDIEFRVFKTEFDPAKTFGTSYWLLSFRADTGVGVSLCSGWNVNTPPASTFNTPTGIEFLDYHSTPAAINSNAIAGQATNLVQGLSGWSPNPGSAIFLDRWTSAEDARQTWFVLRQGVNSTVPFTFLHRNTVLHDWLDLNRGVISGFMTAHSFVSNRAGYVNFRLQENIRRALLIGTCLRGQTANNGFHGLQHCTNAYVGLGSQAGSFDNNRAVLATGSAAGAYPLPVGVNAANPAYPAESFYPICSEHAWCPFTPTLLAKDFGVYMHYADNVAAYYDKYQIQAGLNEWRVLGFANNQVITDGASPSFVARVV